MVPHSGGPPITLLRTSASRIAVQAASAQLYRWHCQLATNLKRSDDNLLERLQTGRAQFRLGESRRPGHFISNQESFAAEFSIISGRKQVASRAEMRSNDSVYFDKALGVPSGFEPSHSPLPFTRRLVRVLGSVVQIPMLSMSNPGHHDPFRRRVTAQLIGYDHARWSSRCPQQPTEKLHCGKAIPLRLHKNV
jgi:hypothetical protein